jgi:hypothetical protein
VDRLGGCFKGRCAATRLVALDAEATKVRNQMRRLLANSVGAPVAAHPSSARRKAGKQHPNARKAERAEARIVALLKEKAMGPAEIVKTASSRPSTTNERLRRMKEKGLIERGEDGWSATAEEELDLIAPWPHPPKEVWVKPLSAYLKVRGVDEDAATCRYG